MASTLSQVFPPAPLFTEQSLPDLCGNVYIVTGSAVFVGYQLAKILYGNNGTVYIATRSSEKIQKAIEPAVQKFSSRENRLDVIFHNAGVMTPRTGSKTKLGHDLEMGTNCLGPFLLNLCLEPLLRKTSKASMNSGEVRVAWVTSFLAVGTEKKGIIFDQVTGNPKVLPDAMKNYMQSKVGNVFLAHESARRLGKDGIICMSVHPGLMKTELQRHSSPLLGKFMGLVFKPARYGAYSELFAGLSPEVKAEHNGGFVIPWGRHGTIPDHIAEGMKINSECGSGLSQIFWNWCDRETKNYQ